MTAERAPAFFNDTTIQDHELVRRALPPNRLDRLRILHSQRAGLLAVLDTVPATVSHLDAWRANLLARDGPTGTETVAIDWSLLGLAPAGQEIAIFVTGARLWLTLGPAEAAALGELAFRSYVDGLRAAGWNEPEEEVRLAYAASVALWAGIPAPLWLGWFTQPDRREWLEGKFRMRLEDAAKQFAAFIGFALDLGDEALASIRT